MAGRKQRRRCRQQMGEQSTIVSYLMPDTQEAEAPALFTFSRRRLLMAISLVSLPVVRRWPIAIKRRLLQSHLSCIARRGSWPMRRYHGADAAPYLLEGQAGIPAITTANTLPTMPDLILTFGTPPPGYVRSSPLVPVLLPPSLTSAHQWITFLVVRSSHSSPAPVLTGKPLRAPYSLPLHLHTMANLPLPKVI